MKRKITLSHITTSSKKKKTTTERKECKEVGLLEKNVNDTRIDARDILPIELWAYIFEPCNARYIRQARSVCKAWNDVILRCSSRLTLNKNDNVLWIAVQYPNIRQLRVKDIYNFDSKYVSLYCQRIETVTLQNIKPDIRLFSYFRYLTDLTLVFDDAFRKECLGAIFKHISNDQPKIRELTLVNKVSHCYMCVKEYARLTSITKLTIYKGENFCYDAICAMTQLPKLEVLDMSCTTMNNFPDDVEGLYHMIGKIRCKKIIFSKSQVDRMKVFIDMLSKSKSIKLELV